MSDKEKEFFSSMSQAEFEEYIANVYAAYNGQDNQEGNGNRHLYGYALCSTCDEKCVDDENERQQQEFYEELEKLFEKGMCVEADNGSGYYIGHTCGNNGRSIELAFFEDGDCKHLASNQNAYDFYENAVTQYFFYENANDDQNGDAQEEYNFDPEDLGNAYMSMIVEMYNREFSCKVGAEREGGDNVSIILCRSLASFSGLFLLILHVIFSLPSRITHKSRTQVKAAKLCSRNPFRLLNASPTTKITRTKTTRTPTSLMVTTLPTLITFKTLAPRFFSLNQSCCLRAAPTPTPENPSFKLERVVPLVQKLASRSSS